jgi:hypothetical protein
MKRLLTACLLLTGLSGASAQDDLLKMLQDSSAKTDEPVRAVFKSTRIINAQTTEMLGARNLDFRVAHRFGNAGDPGAEHTLFGLDNSSDIRIAFEYGITSNLMAGVSRSKYAELYEGFVKYRVLQQTTNNKTPLSIALIGNTGISTQRREEYTNTTRRISYLAQAVLSRKFSQSFSFEVLPTFLHRNFVKDADDENDIFAIGAGGRLKVTRSSAIIADYYYIFSSFRNRSGSGYYMPLGIGWEVETGGHVFSLMFSNADGLVENNYLADTNDSWLNGGFKFSFNISRVFKL